MMNDRMSLRGKILMVMAIILTITAYSCQPDPDIACKALCSLHGTVFVKRVNKMIIQECICEEARHH